MGHGNQERCWPDGRFSSGNKLRARAFGELLHPRWLKLLLRGCDFSPRVTKTTSGDGVRGQLPGAWAGQSHRTPSSEGPPACLDPHMSLFFRGHSDPCKGPGASLWGARGAEEKGCPVGGTQAQGLRPPGPGRDGPECPGGPTTPDHGPSSSEKGARPGGALSQPNNNSQPGPSRWLFLEPLTQPPRDSARPQAGMRKSQDGPWPGRSRRTGGRGQWGAQKQARPSEEAPASTRPDPPLPPFLPLSLPPRQRLPHPHSPAKHGKSDVRIPALAKNADLLLLGSHGPKGLGLGLPPSRCPQAPRGPLPSSPL